MADKIKVIVIGPGNVAGVAIRCLMGRKDMELVVDYRKLYATVGALERLGDEISGRLLGNLIDRAEIHEPGLISYYLKAR